MVGDCSVVAEAVSRIKGRQRAVKYISYKGTPYEKKVVIPERKRFGEKSYELTEVFPNYGSFRGHRQALGFARQSREQGLKARVEAHSGYTAIYVRR